MTATRNDAGRGRASHEPPRPPRFGFTATKRLGNAVRRNRAKRRLRELVRNFAAGQARAGYDYVLIARAGALQRPFADLRNDLAIALSRVHQGRRPSPPPRIKSIEGQPRR